jgi:mono/diheme cytochrome c family protein
MNAEPKRWRLFAMGSLTARIGPLLAILAVLLPTASAVENHSERPTERLYAAHEDPLRLADIWDPLGSEREYWTPERFDQAQTRRMRRHWTFTQKGVPKTYRGLVNPLGLTPEAVQAGGRVYGNWCADCHGEAGMGDGEFGLSLRPSPALLAFMIQVPMAVDEYLLWSISEGGSAFGTDMPAFGEMLSREEIWAVISYMRSGFQTLEEE